MASSVIEMESDVDDDHEDRDSPAAFSELPSDFVAPPTDTALTDSGRGNEQHTEVGRTIGEWLVVLIGAVAVALLLRTFVLQAFWIPSESMEHTLQAGDRVLVNKLSYRLHEVNRGDIVVFVRPDEQQGEIRDLIKRVIGIEGDVVEGRDNQVFVNGVTIVEPYLASGEFIGDFAPVEIPAGEVFVMGDNRDESYDSRFFGTVSTDRIVGRAFVLFWPMGRRGLL